jgi:hypothetical protein
MSNRITAGFTGMNENLIYALLSASYPDKINQLKPKQIRS